MDSKAFIFYGPSGSGKGTQAKLLIKYLEEKRKKPILYVETGQQFRDFFNSETYTSELTRKIVDKGGLLPAFLPIWIWTDFFNENFNGEEDLVLDGLCRRPAEAPVLDSALKFYGIKNPTIIILNVPDESVVKRLQERGRTDDTSDYIKRRLGWYKEEVIPTIEFFRNSPDYTIFDIKGEQSVEDVHKEIVNKLDL